MVERLRLVDDFGILNCKHSDNQKNDKIARFGFANRHFLVEIVNITETETVAAGNSAAGIDTDD